MLISYAFQLGRELIQVICMKMGLLTCAQDLNGAKALNGQGPKWPRAYNDGPRAKCARPGAKGPEPNRPRTKCARVEMTQASCKWDPGPNGTWTQLN